ncbi:MAG: hypothetical protein IV100_09485 [Myxococcales bacterium]|nr:hypothetical protein [Myxococcales bacterium]
MAAERDFFHCASRAASPISFIQPSSTFVRQPNPHAGCPLITPSPERGDCELFAEPAVDLLVVAHGVLNMAHGPMRWRSSSSRHAADSHSAVVGWTKRYNAVSTCARGSVVLRKAAPQKATETEQVVVCKRRHNDQKLVSAGRSVDSMTVVSVSRYVMVSSDSTRVCGARPTSWDELVGIAAGGAGALGISVATLHTTRARHVPRRSGARPRHPATGEKKKKKKKKKN